MAGAWTWLPGHRHDESVLSRGVGLRPTMHTSERTHLHGWQGKALMLMERFADARRALDQGARICPHDAELKEALAALDRDWPGGSVPGGVATVHTGDREASAKRCALLPGIPECNAEWSF